MDRAQDFQLERILKDYHKLIYSVCFMFSKDLEEAKDMYQEVALNIWKGIDTFRNECNIKSWIYRICFNTCISFERKRKQEVFVQVADNLNICEEEDTSARQIQMLYKRISRLEHFDRAIILLWLEAMPYQEIADIVGISVKNVSVRLSRIRAQLKSMK